MKQDPYIKLAKLAIQHHLKTGKTLEIPPDLPKKMLTRRAGTFVSLHNKRDGSLRGCIGTFLPTKENIAQEIIANAISATHDPRFSPLGQEELSGLLYSVDIIAKLKTISNHKLIDPKKSGLLVSTPDGRRGLLLPDILGVETAEEQIVICKRKAGIASEEKVKLQIFTVERHGKATK